MIVAKYFFFDLFSYFVHWSHSAFDLWLWSMTSMTLIGPTLKRCWIRKGNEPSWLTLLFYLSTVCSENEALNEPYDFSFFDKNPQNAHILQFPLPHITITKKHYLRCTGMYILASCRASTMWGGVWGKRERTRECVRVHVHARVSEYVFWLQVEKERSYHPDSSPIPGRGVIRKQRSE